MRGHNEILIDFDTFKTEIDKARKRQPYTIDIVTDYLLAVRGDYRNFGDIEEGYFKAKFVEAADMAAPIVSAYIEECERTKSAIVAAYGASNTRQNEHLKRFKFWQGVAFTIACLTVTYCAFRTVVWLAPFWPSLVNWVDSRL